MTYWGLELLMVVFSDQNYLFWEPIVNIIFNTAVFYFILFYVFPQKSTTINYGRLGIKLLLTLVLWLCTKTGYTYLLDKFGYNLLYNISDIKFFLLANVYRFSLFSIYAGFIWFFTTKNKLQQTLLVKDLEEQKLKNALLIAEYSALKAQINPHFLFNTLGFIYSKAVVSSDEVVSKSILLLSDVLRYSLQDIKQNEKIPLNRELDYIRKLCEINKLRFDGKCFVDILSYGEEFNKKIPPFILLTLFENAMKHGDFQDPTYPIIFEIHQQHKSIKISVTNRKKEKPDADKNESFKIGNTYIINILDSFYDKNYSRDIDNQEEEFKFNLIINSDD